MFNIVLRSKTVDIILDQAKAEEIVQLGVRLAEQSSRPRVTEAGDSLAKAIARDIEERTKEAKADTLTLTLDAMPFSRWKDALQRNTITKGDSKGMRDILGVAKSCLPDMIRSATLGGKPVKPEDLDVKSISDLLDGITDGQFTPVWNTIMDLNGKAADPKAAADLASRVLN